MKEINLTQGKVALVDDEDYDYLMQWKWLISKSGNFIYAGRNVWMKKEHKYKMILMHRIIMNTPQGLDVDHIDHNGLNNQKYNLRNCTNAENKWNSSIRQNKKYKGIRKRIENRSNPFEAYITFNGRFIHLGHFKTEEDAARAYNNAAKEYFGEFANPNIIKI